MTTNSQIRCIYPRSHEARDWRLKLKISIAIVNFNRASFLKRAIRSAQNQVRIGFDAEIIFVDDGSTDGSQELAKTFDNCLTSKFLSDNAGVGNASQIALEMATGDYFMRLDSDDFLSPISCLTFFTALEAKPGFSFAYADHFRVDDRETRVSLVELDNFNDLTKHGAGVMFRTSVLKEVGGYDAHLRHGEDADLFYRLARAGHAGLYLPIPLYRYHIHGANLSLNPEQKRLQDQVRRQYEL